MSVPLQCEGDVVPHHLDIITTAYNRYDFLPQALQRVSATESMSGSPERITITPLAVGGAMAVYKISILLPYDLPQYLVCKIPHDRRLVYTAETEHQDTEASTYQLLERLVALSEHLAQQAPGLFPRSGGVWHWQTDDGTPKHLLVEEFIPGPSIERLKQTYEEQLVEGQITTAIYQQRRTALERLAVATFTRLWDGLGRRTFTSDPTPWNVLTRQVNSHEFDTLTATIIDLHGLEDNVGLSYVVQRLAAVYGMRRTVLEEVILPGILDTLGMEEGRELLQAELPHLEAQAHQSRRSFGVDLLSPVIETIRNLA